MKDFIESIKAHVLERLSSPFMSPFVVTWLVLNWDLVVALIGSGDYQHKIFYIEDILLRDRWLQLTIWPFLGALVYLLASPVLNSVGAYIVGKGKILQKTVTLRAEREMPISREEREEMYVEFDKTLKKATSENEKLNQRIARTVGVENSFVKTHRMHIAIQVANWPIETWPSDDLVKFDHDTLSIRWEWTLTELDPPSHDRLWAIAKRGVPRSWLLALDKSGPDKFFEAREFVSHIGPPEQALLALDMLVAVCVVDVSWSGGELMYRAAHAVEPVLANIAGRKVRVGWSP